MEQINISKEKVEGITSKVKDIGGFVLDVAIKQCADEGTISISTGIGILSGLAHGSIKRGVKTGLTVLGVFAGVSVIKNVANNWDEIKGK
jgi:hypothetical protein